MESDTILLLYPNARPAPMTRAYKKPMNTMRSKSNSLQDVQWNTQGIMRPPDLSSSQPQATMSCTASSRSIRSTSSSPSVSSAGSVIVQTATKALSAVKTAVKTALRPKKKARVGQDKADEANTAASQSDKDNIAELKRLQAIKDKVDVVYNKDHRKAHVFHCAAKRCKGKGTVRRYQDSKDRAATSNLKTHAVRCFRPEAVNAAFSADNSTSPRDGSIFAAFARQGQQPVTVSHRALTAQETRARIALWCAESNRPMNIVQDHQFTTLMQAGRPSTIIPSPSTVLRDIKTAFEASRASIDKILRDHDGRVHFATDAWTSPNHQAMVAWMVHLHHEGNILVFLLDVCEVDKSHTGETLVAAFHQMLIKHGLKNKILAVNADNASSNDTQTDALDALPNSFSCVNCVRCFNHTLQLAVKALLRPFSKEDGDKDDEAEALPELEPTDEDDDDEDGDDTEMTKLTSRTLLPVSLQKSSQPCWPTQRQLALSSSSCGLREHLIPRDVQTRWNSTFDMLRETLKYCTTVDAITADKALNLRHFELSDDE
ncbi:hypothetical protein H0H92_002873 [Tricholoma furcatifolium]|nr:hypothetical protein H0H92_002873 [Tricholoma furcatifolium]